MEHHSILIIEKIEVKRKDLDLSSNKYPWNEIIDTFAEKISKLTNNKFTDLLVGNFSTTNNVSLTVSQMVLMDSLQKYFDYTLSTMCGIPEIRLTGTKKDWEIVKNKASGVLKLIPDLNAWINGSLNEVLDHFVNAFDDKIDTIFWNSIYKSNLNLNSKNFVSKSEIPQKNLSISLKYSIVKLYLLLKVNKLFFGLFSLRVKLNFFEGIKKF